jgi:hypothetical protein
VKQKESGAMNTRPKNGKHKFKAHKPVAGFEKSDIIKTRHITGGK